MLSSCAQPTPWSNSSQSNESRNQRANTARGGSSCSLRGFDEAQGTQTIRLVFDQPQTLKRISLVFEEKETGRTKSSSYVGLPMAGARFGKLFASSGISALLRQYARSKNIKLSYQTSPYSN